MSGSTSVLDWFVRAAILVCLLCLGGLYVLIKTDRGNDFRLCLADKTSAGLLKRDFEFVVDFKGLKYKGYAGRRANLLDRDIFEFGPWEDYELTFFRDTASALHSPDLVFFDIGAYTGTYSLYLSQFVRTVHAFEPLPDIVQRFNDNVQLNRITNIVLHPIGLGAADGSFPFYPSVDRNPGTGSFIKEWRPGQTNAIDLPLRKGDGLDAETLQRVDLMKIDVEGFEKQVLIGFKETIRRALPIIALEINVGPNGFSEPAEVKAQLPESYELRELIPLKSPFDPDYRLAPFNTHDIRQRNVVAFPKVKEALIPLHNS